MWRTRTRALRGALFSDKAWVIGHPYHRCLSYLALASLKVTAAPCHCGGYWGYHFGSYSYGQNPWLQGCHISRRLHAAAFSGCQSRTCNLFVPCRAGSGHAIVACELEGCSERQCGGNGATVRIWCVKPNSS